MKSRLLDTLARTPRRGTFQSVKDENISKLMGTLLGLMIEVWIFYFINICPIQLMVKKSVRGPELRPRRGNRRSVCGEEQGSGPANLRPGYRVPRADS